MKFLRADRDRASSLVTAKVREFRYPEQRFDTITQENSLDLQSKGQFKSLEPTHIKVADATKTNVNCKVDNFLRLSPQGSNQLNYLPISPQGSNQLFEVSNFARMN